jgi:hypothetical protein
MQEYSKEKRHENYLKWKENLTEEKYQQHLERNRIHKRERFANNIKKYRKENALAAKKRRSEKREESRAYIAQYYRERMHNDENFRLRHNVSTNLTRIMNDGANPLAFTYKTTSQFKDINKREIYDHLIKLGWQKGKNTIDHILPVKFLIDNGFKDIKILMAIENLQILTMKSNSSKYNYIKYDYQLTAARKLETKYPELCKGLTVLVAAELQKGQQ